MKLDRSQLSVNTASLRKSANYMATTMNLAVPVSKNELNFVSKSASSIHAADSASIDLDMRIAESEMSGYEIMVALHLSQKLQNLLPE
jgi:hypothetical protein